MVTAFFLVKAKDKQLGQAWNALKTVSSFDQLDIITGYNYDFVMQVAGENLHIVYNLLKQVRSLESLKHISELIGYKGQESGDKRVAYLFIRTEVAPLDQLREELSLVEFVEGVYEVSGEYDLLVAVKGENFITQDDPLYEIIRKWVLSLTAQQNIIDKVWTFFVMDPSQLGI